MNARAASPLAAAITIGDHVRGASDGAARARRGADGHGDVAGRAARSPGPGAGSVVPLADDGDERCTGPGAELAVGDGAAGERRALGDLDPVQRESFDLLLHGADGFADLGGAEQLAQGPTVVGAERGRRLLATSGSRVS